MFGSEEDLIVEFPGVSWLIWLHLLVMFLLCFLLFSFLGNHVFPEIEDRHSSTSASKLSSDDHHGTKQLQKNHTDGDSNCSWIDKKVVGDVETIEGYLATSTERIKMKLGKEEYEEEEIEEMGESSLVALRQKRVMHFSVDPCHYLGQVLKPFLKCLGLQSTFPDPPTTKPGGRNPKKMTQENLLDPDQNVDSKTLQ